MRLGDFQSKRSIAVLVKVQLFTFHAPTEKAVRGGDVNNFAMMTETFSLVFFLRWK